MNPELTKPANLNKNIPKICNNNKGQGMRSWTTDNPTRFERRRRNGETRGDESFARRNGNDGEVVLAGEDMREHRGEEMDTGARIRGVSVTEQQQLKIALWNMRGLEASKLREVIKSNADIITLNEIGNKFTTLVNIEGYRYLENLRCRRSGGGTGLLIKNTLRVKIIKHSIEDTLISKITVGRSMCILLISTYFSPEFKRARLEELEKELKRVKEEYEWIPIVICGDLNLDLNNDGVYENRLKVILREHMNGYVINRGLITRETETGSARLDYILDNLYGDDCLVEEGNYIGYSDHFCISKNLTINREPTRIYSRSIDRLKIQIENNRSINMTNDFLKCHSERWESINSRAIKNVKKSSLEERISRNFLKIDKETWNYVNKNLQKNKKEFRVYEFLFGLTTFDKYGRKKLKKLRIEGEIHEGAETIDRKIFEWYSREHNGANGRGDETRRLIDCFGNNIGEEEIRNACNSIKLKKAFADDWVNDELIDEIKKGNTRLLEYFLDILNNPTEEKLNILSFFTRGTLTPILKKEVEIAEFNDIRPIIVPSIIYKLIENVFKQKLIPIQKRQLKKCQIGFCPDLETGMAVSHVMKKATEYRQAGKGILIFFDLKSAYDSIKRESVSEALRKYHQMSLIDERTMFWIEWMVSKFWVSFKGRRIENKKGVPQGGVISPILFNMVYDTLAQELESIIGLENVMMFADDLVIMVQTKVEMGDVISKVKQWAAREEITINYSKCGLLEISKGKKILSRMESYEGIPEVEEYKYLGIWINKSLKMRGHIKKEEGRYDILNNGIKSVKGEFKLIRYIQLWKVTMRPRLIKLASVWEYVGKEDRKAIKKKYYSKLKEALGLRRNANDEWVEWLLGESIEDTCEKTKRRIEIKWRCFREGVETTEPEEGERVRDRSWRRKKMQKILMQLGWGIVPYLNKLNMICRAHVVRNTESHMEREHGMKGRFEKIMRERTDAREINKWIWSVNRMQSYKKGRTERTMRV